MNTGESKEKKAFFTTPSKVISLRFLGKTRSYHSSIYTLLFPELFFVEEFFRQRDIEIRGQLSELIRLDRLSF